MKQVTRDDLKRRYGYFLQSEVDADRFDPDADAAAHVTPDAIERFLAVARTQWGSVTVAQTIFKLRRMAELLRPGPSYSWLQDIELDLRADAKPKGRHENVTSDQLLEAGEALFREAELATHLSPKDQAVLARNGLMIALLAVHPIRHKNLTELDLGDSFRRVDEIWWIVLEATETKGGRADERPVPDYLTPTVERYVTTFRPILLAKAADTLAKTGPLWVSVAGDRLTYSGLGAAITDTTYAVLGVRLSPHAFRRAAKATVTFFGGAHPRLIEGVLQHSGLRVGEEHYDTSPIHRAALELTAIVKSLRKT